MKTIRLPNGQVLPDDVALVTHPHLLTREDVREIVARNRKSFALPPIGQTREAVKQDELRYWRRVFKGWLGASDFDFQAK